MYGLLLEGLRDSLVTRYGVNVWNEIRTAAKVSQHGFASHDCYGDSLFTRLVRAASDVTQTSYDDMMELAGRSFVHFVGHFGYAEIMRVTGRQLADFIDGLDNFHEYLRASYPRMRAPSFVCEDATSCGLRLRYRSCRGNLTHYVIGQLKEIGVTLFNMHIDIDVIKMTQLADSVDTILQLHFENDTFERRVMTQAYDGPLKLISQAHLCNVFPFHIRFDANMMIISTGPSINRILPKLVGQRLDVTFSLTKPPINFTFTEILGYKNNLFQLKSATSVCTREDSDTSDGNVTGEDDEFDTSNEVSAAVHVHLKGQMVHLSCKPDAIIFIASPLVHNLQQIDELGLYIHDLSLHDASRDVILAGSQRSKTIKAALNKERQKRQRMEQALRLLDAEIQKGDSLLYRMIPRQVADKLRRGETALSTCETFDEVTILFSDVIGFSSICNRIRPMDIVQLLNGIFSKYDELTERHCVYKVETTGDAYMLVSGAPTRISAHAQHICNIAFDLRRKATGIFIPEIGTNIKIRIGIHSGAVVAGIIGMKMPRYCLFGDTVNTASRMKSNCEAMRIHISQTTKRHLRKLPFTVASRGTIWVKGKGKMKTYYLLTREEEEIELNVSTQSNSVSSITQKTDDGLVDSADLWRRRSSNTAQETFVPLLASEIVQISIDESHASRDTRSKNHCTEGVNWLTRKCRVACMIL